MGIPRIHSMPSRDVYSETRLAEASWRCDVALLHEITTKFEEHTVRKPEMCLDIFEKDKQLLEWLSGHWER